MRKWLTFFVAITLSWTAYIRTDGFTRGKIAHSLPTTATHVASDEVLEILSRPFHYLGKGRQSFVFASDDGRYVLKFFNQNYFQMPWYAFFCYQKEKSKRDKRRGFFEGSYEIAFREFCDEIDYLHMGQGGGLPLLTMRGPAHSTLRVDLNETAFVLQRRGESFYARLDAIYQKEGVAGLCREIDAFMGQIAKRIEKQIADADVDVEHNWGYVDGKIFHLDPGRLYRDPSLECPERQKKEWHIATHRFVQWLNAKHYDEALKYLENQLPAN